MSMSVTRGGLRPAKITNLKTKTKVEFMFNPSEFTISKQISWSDGKEQGVDAPQSIFNRGEVRTIELTLLFDTQDSGGDVTYYTAKLWEMTMIESSTKDAKTGKGLPSPVAFEWNKLYFKAIITSISETFKLFSDRGVPLRSEVKISLREYVEADDTLSASISSGSNTAPRSVTASGSDRIDNMAIAGLISALQWRDMADANNIDNPLNIPNGTNLNVP